MSLSLPTVPDGVELLSDATAQPIGDLSHFFGTKGPDGSFFDAALVRVTDHTGAVANVLSDFSGVVPLGSLDDLPSNCVVRAPSGDVFGALRKENFKSAANLSRNRTGDNPGLRGVSAH